MLHTYEFLNTYRVELNGNGDRHPLEDAPVHIISLGAGVQSSTMALMAAHGEITPMPKCAIFADTQAEPKSVYRWLDWLEKQLPFPVRRVSSGNLRQQSLEVRKSKKTGAKYLRVMIPAFTLNKDGSKGMFRRTCTDKAKLTPLRNAIREISNGEPVEKWIGISRDEVHRMKQSQDETKHRYPLVDAGVTRHGCLKSFSSKGLPKPPRSACEFCPYHSDREWVRLRDEEPDAFARSVIYERELQKAAAQTPLTGVPFLHKSCVPLDQVDFSTDEDHGQQVMFGNECEGMCGV